MASIIWSNSEAILLLMVQNTTNQSRYMKLFRQKKWEILRFLQLSTGFWTKNWITSIISPVLFFKKHLDQNKNKKRNKETHGVFFEKKQLMCFCDHLHVNFGWLSAAYLLPGSSCILQSAMSTLGSWYCEVAKVLPPFHQSTAGFLGIYIPSLKLTASLHLKMGAPWKRRFLLESNIFWVRTVSFRECIWWRLREFGHPLVLRNNLGEVVASCGELCGSFFLIEMWI